jgi:hypothetical protein
MPKHNKPRPKILPMDNKIASAVEKKLLLSDGLLSDGLFSDAVSSQRSQDAGQLALTSVQQSSLLSEHLEISWEPIMAKVG